MTKKQHTDAPVRGQRKWLGNLLWILVFLGLFLLLRPFMQGDVVEGQAPDFTATTLQGETVRLSDFHGQTVLVHFWATWCPICEFEVNAIERVAEDWPVLNVATQSGAGSELTDYVQTHNMNAANVVLDPDGRLFQRYGAKAVPATFVVNPAGEIEFVEVGYSTSWGLRARLWWASQ
ncbi:redoxin domain-containing protein [Thiomicrospira sp. WB1]|uniref:redoxin domain-containing protein n=1 Tax=Thiomicrospira sp. WB1 TaxID=1685380 RepID=UPI0007471007|nr:redoxin domain-containing protein [Thiomicrospira sp. WB1]KUJ71750.1 alkyl hydroperoxide reductase [Thiomicrospira sp. WB1]